MESIIKDAIELPGFYGIIYEAFWGTYYNIQTNFALEYQ
jgi:hypothetical protein